MRYIALNEDAEQPIAPAPVPQSDGRISDEVCITVLSVLDTLKETASRKARSCASRDMIGAAQYHNGCAAAHGQAIKLLTGILTGEYAAQRLSAVEICKQVLET